MLTIDPGWVCGHKGSMADVLVAGALHWATTLTVPALPQAGQSIAGDAADSALGGRGGQQALAASRMGARVTMAGGIGTDGAGRNILRTLSDARVSLRGLQEIPGPSGTSITLTTPQGATTTVTAQGVNAQIIPGQITMPGGLKVLHFQTELDPSIGQSLIARASGAEVVVHASPMTGLPPDLLRQVDILIVNRQDAAVMADTPEGMANALLAQGPGTVIITLGQDGCLLAQRGTTASFPGHRVAALSMTGGGDAFAGALCAARAKGLPIEHAIRRAQTYAALVVATTGHERPAIGPQHVDQLVG